MRKYDLVIFDMDGTILNTLDDIHNAVNAALSKYGYPLKTIDETRKNVGNGFRKTLERSFAMPCVVKAYQPRTMFAEIGRSICKNLLTKK